MIQFVIKTWNNNTLPLRGHGQISLSQIDEIWQSQTRSSQNQLAYQVWWKSIEIYSSYFPETQIQMCRRQIKFTHLLSWTRSPQYQCTYQVSWKSIDIYWGYLWETKIRMCWRQITPSKIDEICLLAIPNQLFIISMHIPSLVKIHLYLFELLSWNKYKEVQTDIW